MTAYSSSSEYNALNYISDKHFERVKLVSLPYTSSGYFLLLILIQPMAINFWLVFFLLFVSTRVPGEWTQNIKTHLYTLELITDNFSIIYHKTIHHTPYMQVVIVWWMVLWSCKAAAYYARDAMANAIM